MRFVLVYTPVKIEGIYKDVIKGVALPPQGICQLAGVIRDYGEEVYLIDALAEDLSEEDAINRIISLNPDFVGFSATTMQILYACQCARLIKEHDQSINVWIGGAHISACPEETMERFKEFDLGVLNEGEVTVKELLRYYKDGAPSLDNINGIIYRSNGKLVKTRPRAFMNDLDSLPLPAWDLLPDLRYNYRQSVARIDRLPAASLTTSRGCPCKCIFCAKNVYGRSYRGHSAEYVLEMAKMWHTKVIYASTSDVYGMSPDLPFKESGDLLLGPGMVRRWSYAVAKLYGEQLTSSYYHDYDIPVVVLRYFGGFSPRSSFAWSGGHIPIFVRAILNDEEVMIHGDGKQTRSMAYVDDLVDGTILAMENDDAIGELFNLGNDEEISVLDSAKIIHRLANTGKALKKRFIPFEEIFGEYKDIMRRVPDLTKAMEILGYAPKFSFEKAIKKTLAHLRK